MNGREYRQKETPEIIGKRFMALCKKLEFGRIEVEVANGVPKDIQVNFQHLRLDLTDANVDGMLGIVKANGSSHDGESQ